MSINILCVDDNSSWRRIFQMHFLEYLTPNVDLAENYSSAIQKIGQKKYDLIVLDGLDGDCFKIYNDIKTIPHGEVIIFSGDTQCEFKAKKLDIPFYNKSNALKGLDKIVASYKSHA